jgi:tRNA pseudouridine32 synthase/23S rRNA pseudouridine746 synthase
MAAVAPARLPFTMQPPLPPAPTQAPQLLHADEALLVLDKPAGLLAVAGKGEAGQVHLAGWVQQRWPEALVVHRLDMATSGLMLFARGIEMQRALSRLFEKRRMAKTYEAIAQGLVEADAGQMDAAMRLDWPNRPRQRVDHDLGRPAQTDWQAIAHAPGETRVALAPITGRSHQLRVHMLALGHPILGDVVYGGHTTDIMMRQALHATRLDFVHPVSAEPLSFTADLPSDMEQALVQSGLHYNQGTIRPSLFGSLSG